MKEIEKFCAIYRKHLGDVRVASEVACVSVMPTGLRTFDEYVLGTGGLPRGQAMEFFGKFSSGKTTLALKAVAGAQAAGCSCAWWDVEGAFDPVWAAGLGVNIDELMLPDFKWGEDVLSGFKLLASAGLDLGVIDSVGALRARQAVETADEDMKMNISLARAKMVTAFFESLIGGFTVRGDKSNSPHRLSKLPTCLIVINHVKGRVGVTFGVQEETVGGDALKLLTVQRLGLKKSADKSMGQDTMGNDLADKIMVRCIKNKLAPPFRECTLRLWRKGKLEEDLSMVLKLAESKKIVKGSGGWYQVVDGHGEHSGVQFHGTAQFERYCRKHPELVTLIMSEGIEPTSQNVKANIDDAVGKVKSAVRLAKGEDGK